MPMPFDFKDVNCSDYELSAEQMEQLYEEFLKFQEFKQFLQEKKTLQKSEEFNPNPNKMVKGEVEKQNNGSIYSKEYLVIQNRLLNAITDLTLNERRLILFLSPIVRREVSKNSTNRTFSVCVRDFADHYNIESNGCYTQLKNISKSLLNKSFFYWDWDNNCCSNIESGVAWVSNCKYIEKEGRIALRLDDDVIYMLTVFDKHNPFTKVQLQAIVNLGTYGIILYLLISSCLNQSIKQKIYTIEFMREQFNCIDKYPVFTDFKRHVIQTAIKEIEKSTTLRISFEPVKTGRKTTAVKFVFSENKAKNIKKPKEIQERDKHTIDLVDGYTDEERAIADRAEQELLVRNPDASATHIINTRNKALRDHKNIKALRDQAKNDKKKKRENETQTSKIYEQQWINDCLPNAEVFCLVNRDCIRSCMNTVMFDRLFAQGDYDAIMSMVHDSFCSVDKHDFFVLPN